MGTPRLSEDVEKRGKGGSIDVAAACSEEGRRKANAENKRGSKKFLDA
jgi:hypothetical protein